MYAAIDPRQRGALAEEFAPKWIGFITREIAYNAALETPTQWSLGPPRSYFEDKIRDLGITPTFGAVALLRYDYLMLYAALLKRAARRHPPSPIERVLMDLDGKVQTNDTSPAQSVGAGDAFIPAPASVAPPPAWPDRALA